MCTLLKEYDFNNFSVNGGIPEKMDGTPHHARSV